MFVLILPLQIHSGSHKSQQVLQLAPAVCKPRTVLLYLEKGSLPLCHIDLYNHICTEIIISVIYSRKKYLLMSFYFQAFFEMLRWL